jgi:hypothetical protein
MRPTDCRERSTADNKDSKNAFPSREDTSVKTAG